MELLNSPHAPGLLKFKVRQRHRAEIANRFGQIYASAVLCRRGEDAKGALYAPVTMGPGEIPVYTWPAVHLDEAWLEPA